MPRSQGARKACGMPSPPVMSALHGEVQSPVTPLQAHAFQVPKENNDFCKQLYTSKPEVTVLGYLPSVFSISRH